MRFRGQNNRKLAFRSSCMGYDIFIFVAQDKLKNHFSAAARGILLTFLMSGHEINILFHQSTFPNEE